MSPRTSCALLAGIALVWTARRVAAWDWDTDWCCSWMEGQTWLA